jgi:hypothetical protein
LQSCNGAIQLVALGNEKGKDGVSRHLTEA